MGILKVNIEELFPPKPPKTKSEAVYVDTEPEPVKVEESKPREWKAQLIQERLKGLNVGDVVYFPELATQESSKYHTADKHSSSKYKADNRNVIIYNAGVLGLKVSVYWVRAKKSQLIPRVTVKKSEGS
jgi:hypothetical protein